MREIVPAIQRPEAVRWHRRPSPTYQRNPTTLECGREGPSLTMARALPSILAPTWCFVSCRCVDLKFTRSPVGHFATAVTWYLGAVAERSDAEQTPIGCTPEKVSSSLSDLNRWAAALSGTILLSGAEEPLQ